MKLSIEFSSSGIELENFKYSVVQGGKTLVEDSLSGRLSSSFVRTFEVEAGEGAVNVVMHDSNIQGLNVIASLS